MIISIIGIVALFAFSIFIPFAGFLLPVYKIKRMKHLTLKKQLLANLIAMIMIGLFDVMLLPFYVVIFLVIETLYYAFEKMKTKLEIFDRIMITSTVVTVLVIIAYQLMFKGQLDLLEVNKDTYKSMMNVSEEEIKAVFEMMRSHAIFLVFIYSFICNYLTYLLLEGKSFRTWKISYKWLIIYIGAFLSKKVLGDENYFLNNILLISKMMYVVFGIKTIYSMLRSKIPHFRGIIKFTAIMTGLTFPMVTFILGAFNSFNMIKIQIIKKKD